MRVDLEEIRDIMERRRKINSLNLEEIEFYEKGVKLDINPEILSDFIYTGLNNFDFITSGFYLDGWDNKNYE